MLGCLLEMCVSKMDPVYTRPGKVRNEEPRIATFTRVRLYFVFCSASLRLSLFFHFLAAMFLESHRRRHFSLFFSRKLASASWSLLALASIGGAAQGHHVIFHAKGGTPPVFVST